jgi:hypothetical protein
LSGVEMEMLKLQEQVVAMKTVVVLRDSVVLQIPYNYE